MDKIVLSGIISQWDVSAKMVREELSKIGGDVEVHINSSGGSFYEGIEIFNLLREHSAKKGKVTTINTAMVASAASHIFCAGDIRKAYDNSTLMVHNAWTITAGSAKGMIETAAILDSIDGIQAHIYSTITGEDIETVKSMLDAETWYIGTEALNKSGLVSHIIKDSRADNISPKAFYSQSMEQFKGKEHSGIDFGKVAASIRVCEGNCDLEIKAASPWDGIVKVRSK